MKFKLPTRFVKVNRQLVIAFFVFLFSVGFLSGTSLAADKDQALVKLEERLKKVEENQELILERQEEIVELIKQLKIWVRRT